MLIAVYKSTNRMTIIDPSMLEIMEAVSVLLRMLAVTIQADCAGPTIGKRSLFFFAGNE